MTRHYLWKLRPYYRQISGLTIIGSVCGVVMNVAVVLPPLLLGHAINVVESASQGSAAPSDVTWAALLFIAGTAATEVPRMGKRYWLGVARARFVASVRSDALRGALTAPAPRASAIPIGDVMARIVGDVQVLGIGVGEVIVETWDTLLFSVSLVVAMIVLAPVLALWALAPVPVALWLAKGSGRVVARKTKVARETASELTVELRERIGAIRLLRLFGRTSAATERVRSLAERQAEAELSAIRLDEALGATYTTVLSSGIVAIIWLGGRLVVAGSLSVGGLVAFLLLFSRFITRSPRIPQMLNRVQAGGAAYQRLTPLLAEPLAMESSLRWASFRATLVPGATSARASALTTPRSATALRFEGVTFTFPRAQIPAVVDVHLDVPAGALVAITGPVGSGKSTLARLAAGILVPDAGTVHIGGDPATSMTAAQRAASVGFLGQEPHLFSGTLSENVTLFGPESGDEGATRLAARALTLAALDADVAALPYGIETPIGELGLRVSGGQRQRIALARAIAAKSSIPGLLILDDPFSAADVHTEAEIVTGLRSAFGPDAPESERTTILLVSHRLAAFPLADLVVVLNQGHIAELGTHNELVARNGLYARIVWAQARLESLSHDGDVAP